LGLNYIGETASESLGDLSSETMPKEGLLFFVLEVLEFAEKPLEIGDFSF